jgi:hypothetical protein
MPPNSHKRSRELAEQEGKILLAISALKNDQIRNISEAARVHNVPFATLRRRLDGHIFRPEARANGHKMTQNKKSHLLFHKAIH